MSETDPGMIRASDYDPDFSHALLIALLMRLGGSAELGAADFAPEALGDAEGRLYGLVMEPLDGGARVRISVAPTTMTSQTGEDRR